MTVRKSKKKKAETMYVMVRKVQNGYMITGEVRDSDYEDIIRNEIYADSLPEAERLVAEFIDTHSNKLL